VGEEAIDGAAAAVAAVRRAGIPLCFATNTTRRPRSDLAIRLQGMGIQAVEEEIFTAPLAAARWLRDANVHSVSLLLPSATFCEFSEFLRDDEHPDAVVVGDLGEQWTYELLDRAARALTAGARLVALHRNRFWNPGSGLRLDAGPFVAALEYASGQTATVVGKPKTPFFTAAAALLGVPVTRVAVVGDNLQTDAVGAQHAGCLAVSVRTGSFSESDLSALDRLPAAVLESIAELPRWLELS
jgi:HAD superfamily hydrolase (TIGR01458 family)